MLKNVFMTHSGIYIYRVMWLELYRRSCDCIQTLETMQTLLIVMPQENCDLGVNIFPIYFVPNTNLSYELFAGVPEFIVSL